MATRLPAADKFPNCIVHRFALSNGDSGAPLMSYEGVRSMQVSGTFGLLGVVILEGSNDDGSTWAPLADVNGSAMSFSSAGVKMFNAPVGKIRPRITGGDGSTSLTVLIQ